MNTQLIKIILNNYLIDDVPLNIDINNLSDKELYELYEYYLKLYTQMFKSQS